MGFQNPADKEDPTFFLALVEWPFLEVDFDELLQESKGANNMFLYNYIQNKAQ